MIRLIDGKGSGHIRHEQSVERVHRAVLRLRQGRLEPSRPALSLIEHLVEGRGTAPNAMAIAIRFVRNGRASKESWVNLHSTCASPHERRLLREPPETITSELAS